MAIPPLRPATLRDTLFVSNVVKSMGSAGLSVIEWPKAVEACQNRRCTDLIKGSFELSDAVAAYCSSSKIRGVPSPLLAIQNMNGTRLRVPWCQQEQQHG